MSEQLEKLRKWRQLFKSIFLFSLIALFFSSLIFMAGPIANLINLISTVSLIASIISLIGFVLTTILALRKEKRETRSSELDNVKKELEIEKLRTELDKLKGDKKIIIRE